jgi:hypothetical protein
MMLFLSGLCSCAQKPVKDKADYFSGVEFEPMILIGKRIANGAQAARLQ